MNVVRTPKVGVIHAQPPRNGISFAERRARTDSCTAYFRRCAHRLSLSLSLYDMMLQIYL